MTYFCPKCGSLLRPGTERCPKCRFAANEDEDVPFEPMEVDDSVPANSPKIIDAANIKAPYLPYEPRASQLEIISEIRNALNAGRHMVIESGTGTGKTIISLAAALEHAIPRGKKIIYLTRTISQSDQVMRELRAISTLKNISGVAITGRGRSCPLYKPERGQEPLSPASLSSACESKKSKKTCPYFNRLNDALSDVDAYCKKEFPKSDQLDDYCYKLKVCPYEMKKLIMKGVDVVTAPYIHILSEDIRSNLLRNMNVDDENILLVIDEAHNLIDAAQEQESFTITKSIVDAALDECSTFKGGDAPLAENVRLSTFIDFIKHTLKSLANEKLVFGKNEALLSPRELDERIFNHFKIDRPTLDRMISQMISIGETREEMLIEKGETRSSDILELAVALNNWMLTEDDRYVRAVKASEDGEYLRAACINPKDVTTFLRMQKGAIHMSGTLQPLEQYVRTIGLPSTTVTKIYPSPFPKENRSIIYVNNLTTRFEDMKRDPSMETRIRRTIAKLCNTVNKNTLVFFPSYGMMNKMREFLERDVNKNLYWEESRRPENTMRSLNEFRKGRDGVFFSVMGGSVAEGIDFPGDELCFAIIVGIPFPPPTLESKAMSDLFDKKYGAWTGWRYVSLTPAMRKMKQAIGRLIRTETDRGMAVILDSRISKYAKDLDAAPSEDPVGDVVRFFEQC